MKRCDQPHCAFPRACAYLSRFDAVGDAVYHAAPAALAIGYPAWLLYEAAGWIGAAAWVGALVVLVWLLTIRVHGR